MMARLLTEEAKAPNEPTEPSKQIPTAPARRLSFKTRQAAARPNYRATKVSLSSTNVALIASKFNTIVVDDSSQGRALLKKISGNQWKPPASKEVKMKTRGEGVVKAAIEIFEHHDLEKHNVKPPYKSKTDLRPKLVVVRKSSSRSSTKQDGSENNESSKNLDLHSKESAKDSRNAENQKDELTHPSVHTYIKEVKRKPSLKEKPVLKHTKIKKKDVENLLDQRIAKFSKSDEINNKPTEQFLSQNIVKPTFDLTERIAQFNKNEDLNPPDNNSINTSTKIEKETKTVISTESEGKENKPSITKSILKNAYNKQSSLVEKTKDKLSSIVLSNDPSNQQGKKNPDKKQSFIKDKFIVREKKGLTVFISKTDSTKSVEETDEGSPRLHLPKDTSILEKALEGESYFPAKSSPDINEHNLKTNKPMANESYTTSPISVQEVSTADSLGLKKDNNITPPNIDVSGRSSVKPTIIPSENPKLEKSYCIASDPHEKLQLDRIKPNNSFLWKPVLTKVVKELPIYDDGPQSNAVKSEGEISSKNNYEIFTNPAPEKENLTSNPLNLDVASSFILEMTEQIERRFSSGSQQDISADDSSFELPCTAKSNNIPEAVSEHVVIKNPSFLYGKNLDDVTPPLHMMEKGNKQDIAKHTKVPPPTFKKPNKAIEGENNPSKLPIKSSILVEGHNENLNKNPPPVPPSHTKPKVVRTPSEETWITNCKKILEIPPPLRRRGGEGSYNGFPSQSQSCQVPLLHQTNNINRNRFSVSQSELLGKISEMNLNNKRISLPPNITSLNLPISQIDVEDNEDYYSSIPNINKQETENQEDTYEDIEENNYAEINEYSEETDNIYDDVVGGEGQGEDHYEAINCLLVPAAGTADSDSSCDQSNSLYGLGRPASLATTGSIYQVTGGSETSDEWVDLDNSDDQHESVIIFREKERGRGLVATESWSMKVRRQWSRNSAGGNGKNKYYSKK